MNTVTIKSPADVAAIACSVLGFTPVESLVIVGLGGAPVARVDLPTDASGMTALMDGLSPAAHHWQHNGVLLVVFSEHDMLSDLTAAFWAHMPTIKVHLAMRTHNGATFVDGTEVKNRTDAADRAGLSAPTQTREDLARAAEAVTDATEALILAWSSYDTGNGARAWVYYDRYIALGGDPSEQTANDLRNRLTYAVPPTATKE